MFLYPLSPRSNGDIKMGLDEAVFKEREPIPALTVHRFAQLAGVGWASLAHLVVLMPKDRSW